MPQRGRARPTDRGDARPDAARDGSDPHDAGGAFDLDSGADDWTATGTGTGGGAGRGTGGGEGAGAASGAGSPRGGGRPLERWPDAAPAWLRGPAALVAAAVLAALVTGGVTAHRRSLALADAVAVERSVGAVDAGEPGLSAAAFGLSGDPVTTEDGSTALHLTVPLTNAGGAAVAVTVTGVVVGGAGVPLRVLGPAATQQLDPLEDGVALLDVGVDCAAVPDRDAAVLDDPAADPDTITASVAVGDEEREVRWVGRSPYGGLDQQLVDVCHTERGSWVEVTGVEQLADGRVRLDVTNRGADPTALQITTPSGSITGDPALPLLLQGDEAGSVVLTAAPDCAQSEDLIDLTVSVTAGTPGETSSEYSPSGAEQLTAWMGGRAALTCG